MKKTILSLIATILLSCAKPTSEQNITVKELPKPKQVVVVQKISLSSGKYQEFIVSGKGFEFETTELTFGVRDTIVIQGSNVYPKSDSTLVIKKYW